MWARSLFLPLSLSLTIIYADITLWGFLAICDLSCWSTTSVLNKEQTYSSKCWSLRIIAVLIEEAKGWCFCHHGSPAFWDKELSLQLLFWFSEGRCRGWGGVHPLHSGVLELVKQPGESLLFLCYLDISIAWTALLPPPWPRPLLFLPGQCNGLCFCFPFPIYMASTISFWKCRPDLLPRGSVVR